MKKNISVLALSIFSLFVVQSSAFADQKVAPSQTPDHSTGSSSVIINGKQAKRAGDVSAEDAIYSPNVFVNGRPAIIGCKKGVPITSPNVFVNGKPAVLGCK